MNETTPQEPKKILSLGERKTLELKKAPAAAVVRQSFSHGRSNTVKVEVRRARNEKVAPEAPIAKAPVEGPAKTRGVATSAAARTLTQEERDARIRALRGAILEGAARARSNAISAEEELSHLEAAATTEAASSTAEERPAVKLDAQTLRQREMDELKRIQDESKQAEVERRKQEDVVRARQNQNTTLTTSSRSGTTSAATSEPRGGAGAVSALVRRGVGSVAATSEEEAPRRGSRGPRTAGRGATMRKGEEQRQRNGRLTVSKALGDEGEVEGRSFAALRRARERGRRQFAVSDSARITRDVIIPEVITVQELANRMAERGSAVIKVLMKMGVMATITQSLDADTAELVATEFGHRPKRVTDADVELGLSGPEDVQVDLQPRPPVVTVMGHVDHGKTSLLDAMRQANVASREAGGITQHIGAYQVVLPAREGAPSGRITFIDTPGHAAFTEMRARGANVTDVVVLVVAADDGVMPQTIEAIRHAKAAGVPMIVAINKCDLPGANPDRVRQALLQHEVQVEAMGGEILDCEVSAKTKLGLDKLLEAILLQAEILQLKANPDRPAEGTVIEAKLDRGRGAVATVLVQRGTLRQGDIVVAGSEWGRVRALIDDHGQTTPAAGPSAPVEILGLQAAPMAGDPLSVVESESRAREICEFRQRRKRTAVLSASTRGSLQQMLEGLKAGTAKELAIVVKGDVQGSVEAIKAALEGLGSQADREEVRVRVLDSSVGAISESDVTLANASRALIIGFNVRANPQARDMARRDGIEIRYYSIIYEIIDDIRAALGNMLAPTVREQIVGNAQVLQVFNITKVGKVAGCKVTEGVIRRGAKVRLLRDSIVVFEGALKTLKRQKDEVKEVREGFECGMAFENFDDVKEGDIIEAVEVEKVARQLA
ncbi:MAG: translation initiation factor IF-2 [Alphaproteobacteria bacterium]|nr:MAG: translation initiation factor IF-2 [Alphaproteobacteria bacterium]